MTRDQNDQHSRKFGEGSEPDLTAPRPVDLRPGRPDVNPIRNTKGQFVSAAGRERVKGRFVKASAEPIAEVYHPDWSKIAADANDRFPKIMAHLEESERDELELAKVLRERRMRAYKDARPSLYASEQEAQGIYNSAHKAQFDADDFDLTDYYALGVPEPSKWSPRRTIGFVTLVAAALWIGSALAGRVMGWW